MIQNKMGVDINVFVRILQRRICERLNSGVLGRNGIGLVLFESAALKGVRLNILPVNVDERAGRFLVADIDHAELCRGSGNHEERRKFLNDERQKFTDLIDAELVPVFPDVLRGFALEHLIRHLDSRSQGVSLPLHPFCRFCASSGDAADNLALYL